MMNDRRSHLYPD